MPVPVEVLCAYGLDAEESALAARHVPSLINLTYVIEGALTRGREPLVLQRMHPVFGAHVHYDIEAVTAHLEARKLTTPRLLRTRSGALWTTEGAGAEARVWRALSYVDGVTVHQSRDLAWLESAAGLLGRFHAALADLDYQFVHERPLHDTSRHLKNLSAVLASERALSDMDAQELGSEILRQAEGVRLDFSSLPRRTIHGDPKLSNVMFERERPGRAKCMIDLDTLGRGYLAYELGDALRSWCNPAGEDTRASCVDPSAFAAVLQGYLSACPDEVTETELLSAIDGVETVSLELASRFAADVVVDQYFGWDSTRFGSRRQHNLLRAQGQLALSRNVREGRGKLCEIAELALGARGRG